MVRFVDGEEIRLLRESLDTLLEREVTPFEEVHRDLLVPDYCRLEADGRLI